MSNVAVGSALQLCTSGGLQHTIPAFLALVKLGWQNNVCCLTQCSENSTFVWIWNVWGWLSSLWCWPPPSAAVPFHEALHWLADSASGAQTTPEGKACSPMWLVLCHGYLFKFLKSLYHVHPPIQAGSLMMQVIAICRVWAMYYRTPSPLSWSPLFSVVNVFCPTCTCLCKPCAVWIPFSHMGFNGPCLFSTLFIRPWRDANKYYYY